MVEMSFKYWLDSTQTQRDRLIAYGQTGQAATAEGRALDSLVAIQMTDEAARILSEARAFLTHEKEKAMWDARKNHQELTSRERDLVEKNAVRDVQLLVDACEVTYKSCLSRYFNYKGRA